MRLHFNSNFLKRELTYRFIFHPGLKHNISRKVLFFMQQLLCAFLQSVHTVGSVQFAGFYVPLVHCGIMQTDLLHVKILLL